jgi:hypothetical protein
MADAAAAAVPASQRVEDLRKQIKLTNAILSKAVTKDDLRAALTAQASVARLSKDLEQELDAQRAAAMTDPLDRVRFMRERAEAAASWVAAARLLADERAIIREREALKSQLTPEKIAADMTAEQWAERLRLQAHNLTDPDLNVFITEWLKRNKLSPVPQQDGAIHLVRQAG